MVVYCVGKAVVAASMLRRDAEAEEVKPDFFLGLSGSMPDAEA